MTRARKDVILVLDAPKCGADEEEVERLERMNLYDVLSLAIGLGFVTVALVIIGVYFVSWAKWRRENRGRRVNIPGPEWYEYRDWRR